MRMPPDSADMSLIFRPLSELSFDEVGNGGHVDSAGAGSDLADVEHDRVGNAFDRQNLLYVGGGDRGRRHGVVLGGGFILSEHGAAAVGDGADPRLTVMAH